MLDLRQVTSVEGRVLVHGQDEQTGRNYLMLEGTDAKVHFIQYTSEMEEARSRGELRTNSFIRMRKLLATAILEVSDLGDAENAKLRQYYPNRSVWLLEPDARPPKLAPYVEEKPAPAAVRETSAPNEPKKTKPLQPALKFEDVPR